MIRRLREEEIRVWALVAGTVKPAPGRAAPAVPPHYGEAGRREAPARADSNPSVFSAPPPVSANRVDARGLPEDIEPNRRRKIERGRQPLSATLDLHGLDQDRAQAALTRFLQRAFDEGHRAVLIITGRGVQGMGVLRRRAPEWLDAPALRHIVAGYSEAHRRHGGDGAIYVALKRKRQV